MGKSITSWVGWGGLWSGRREREGKQGCCPAGCHLTTVSSGGFFLFFPSTREGNPRERGRGQSYLGKVSQGELCEKKNIEQLLVWWWKSVSTGQNDNSLPRLHFAIVSALDKSVECLLVTKIFFIFTTHST